jgi:hypothetical protein
MTASVGSELSTFLNKGDILNGFTSSDQLDFNGMTCLAAQFVATFKKSIGGLYITNKKDFQEFNYHVYYENKELSILVRDENKKIIFRGGKLTFQLWCDSHKR